MKRPSPQSRPLSPLKQYAGGLAFSVLASSGEALIVHELLEFIFKTSQPFSLGYFAFGYLFTAAVNYYLWMAACRMNAKTHEDHPFDLQEFFLVGTPFALLGMAGVLECVHHLPYATPSFVLYPWLALTAALSAYGAYMLHTHYLHQTLGHHHREHAHDDHHDEHECVHESLSPIHRLRQKASLQLYAYSASIVLGHLMEGYAALYLFLQVSGYAVSLQALWGPLPHIISLLAGLPILIEANTEISALLDREDQKTGGAEKATEERSIPLLLASIWHGLVPVVGVLTLLEPWIPLMSLQGNLICVLVAMVAVGVGNMEGYYATIQNSGP